MNTDLDRGPAAGRPKPPALRKPIPYRCSAGRTPCGKSARFFACGWRCVNHAPGSQAA
jgi:hypothetical protein